VVVVLKRTYKNYENQTYHYKQPYVKFPVIPGLSGSQSRMSGHSVPEYPDKHPEFPGNCFPSVVSLRPESPDPSVRSIRTYTRSIQVSFTQRLVFCERGPIPLHSKGSCSFQPENTCKQKKSSLTPLSSFLSDFLWGFK
jgi:hypothetical protein